MQVTDVATCDECPRNPGPGEIHPFLVLTSATMDLACVDLDAQGRPCYPGKQEVERRQQFTTEMAFYFWQMYQHIPVTWTLTLQGWHPEEYVRHAQALAPLIREMAMVYLDPSGTEEDEQECVFRVGLGSLCGRDPVQVHDIIAAVRDTLLNSLPRQEA